MIPVLFKKNEQQFRTYGLGEITDIINPKVTRERNGQYLLYFQYPQNAEFSDVFEEDMRIKSDAGVRTKWQTFEISRVVRKEGQLIEVFAKHISQSLLKDALNPSVNIRSSNAQQALRAWNSNRIGDEDFDVWSDISTTSSTSWNIREVSNAFEALAGVQGSILDIWGGEYEFDNKMIRLHKEMGRKSPVPLEYGRNITGLEQDQQDDNVYTSVYPFATYTPEGDNEPKTVTLSEYYVDGKYLEMHNKRKIQVVDFSGEFEHDDIPTESRLRTLAKQYAETNEVGLPHENLKVEYIDLSKTLDYQEFQTMEEVELNDRLPIFYPKFGITNENAKVVVINYDPVKEENISIELGVIGQSFRTVTTGRIGSRLDRVEKQQDATNNYIVNAKGNRIWFETPDENMEHKVGDTWFEKNGPYDRIHVWNGNQWETIIDSEDIDKNAKEIEATQKELAEAKTKAEQDTAKALEDAKKHADDEVQASKEAFDEQFSLIDEEIEQIQTTANNAINEIEIAVDAAGFTSLSDSLTGIQSIAVESMDLANDLSSQVSGFELTVNGFNQVVNDYEGQVAGFRSDVNGLSSTVASYEDEVAGYATQVSTFENTVDGLQSDITHVDGRINTLSSTVDGTIQRIGDAEGNITQVEANVNGIQETVSDPVNGLVTQVSTLASGFSVVTEDISKIPEWTNIYRVNTENPKELTRRGGSALDTSMSYEIEAGTTGTGTTSGLVASLLFKNDKWEVRIVDQRGANSNHPRIFIEDGVPKVGLYNHASFYNVIVNMREVPTRAITSLTMITGNINARVEKGDVINQINISTEGILIDGERTHITGQTTIDNGVIRNAHIYDLHANKITAGTIATARLNATDIVTKGLSANVVTSTHLKSDTALIDKIFATTANIDRLTGKQAFISSIKAIEISADKITAGTLFGNSVTASGINVDTLVGNTQTFIQSNLEYVDVGKLTGNINVFTQESFNAISDEKITIDFNGIQSRNSSDGEYARIQEGGLNFYRPDTSGVGRIGSYYDSSASERGVSVGLYSGYGYRVEKVLTGGNRTLFEISKNEYIRLRGAQVSVHSSFITNTTTNLHDSRVVVGSTGTTFNQSIDLKDYILYGASRIEVGSNIRFANDSHRIYDNSRTSLNIAADTNLNLGTNNNGAINTVARVVKAGLQMFGVLNMQGRTITRVGDLNYDSDERLKSDITDRKEDDLATIMAIEYKNYQKNDSRQRGFIAQELRLIDDELVIQNEDGYLGYEAQGYVHTIGHAVQQLAFREEDTNKVASQALVNSETNAEKIARLEKEIQKMKEAA